MKTMKPPGGEVSDDLHALYRQGADAEPSAQLDRRIVDAARAAAAESPVERRSTPRSASWRNWRHGWRTAASTALVAVLGVSLAWHVAREDERAVNEVLSAPPPRDETAPAVTGVPSAQADRTAPPLAAVSAKKVLSPAPPKREKAMTAPAAAPIQSMSMDQERAGKESAPAAPARQRSAAPGAAPPAAPAATPVATPGPVHAPASWAGRAGKSSSSVEAAGAEVVLPMREMPADAARRTTGETHRRAADEALTPDQWVKQIRDLRAAGRRLDAERSLAQLRERYPEFVLPDDLQAR